MKYRFITIRITYVSELKYLLCEQDSHSTRIYLTLKLEINAHGAVLHMIVCQLFSNQLFFLFLTIFAFTRGRLYI